MDVMSLGDLIQSLYRERRVKLAYETWEKNVESLTTHRALSSDFILNLKRQHHLAESILKDLNSVSSWKCFERYVAQNDFQSIEYSELENSSMQKLKIDLYGEVHIMEIMTIIRDGSLLHQICPSLTMVNKEFNDDDFGATGEIHVCNWYFSIWKAKKYYSSINFMDYSDHDKTFVLTCKMQEHEDRHVESEKDPVAGCVFLPGLKKTTFYFKIPRGSPYFRVKAADKAYMTHHMHSALFNLIDHSRKMALTDPLFCDVVRRMWCKNGKENQESKTGFYQWIKKKCENVDIIR